MAAEDRALLYLPGRGSVEAAFLGELLSALDRVHTGYLVFERLVSVPTNEDREDWPLWYWERANLALSDPTRPLDRRWVDAFITPAERVLVSRVQLTSPGFWEFLGGLNPLEVVRRFLDDRHRRRQDREYREAEERRQLGLENDLREIEVIERRITAARNAGAPDELVLPLLDRLVGEPAREIGVLQDQGLIDGSRAKLRGLPPGPDERSVG